MEGPEGQERGQEEEAAVGGQASGPQAGWALCPRACF